MSLIGSIGNFSETLAAFAKPLYAVGEIGRGGWDALRNFGTLIGGWFQVGAYNSYSHAAEQQAKAADGIQTTETTRTMIALGQDPANSPEGHAAAERGAAAAGGYGGVGSWGVWPWNWFGGGSSQTAEAQPLRTFTPVAVASAGGNAAAFTPLQQTAQAPAVDPAAQQAAQAQAQAAVDPAARQQVAGTSSIDEEQVRAARMLGNNAYTERYGPASQRS